MAGQAKQNGFEVIGILLALGNLAVFGALFVAMHYFELMGADPAFFDEGTKQNLEYINMITNNFGVTIDPSKQEKVSTLAYAACYGVALLATGFTFLVAGRKANEELEITDPA